MGNERARLHWRALSANGLSQPICALSEEADQRSGSPCAPEPTGLSSGGPPKHDAIPKAQDQIAMYKRMGIDISFGEYGHRSTLFRPHRFCRARSAGAHLFDGCEAQRLELSRKCRNRQVLMRQVLKRRAFKTARREKPARPP